MMFIKAIGGINRAGEQFAKGKFLALFSEHIGKDLYGVVRSCHMTQLGNFMMGFIRIGDQRITVSGTYGSDGLTKDLDKITAINRKYLTSAPADVCAAFWAGEGGWNGAGSEGAAMREWGKAIIKNKTHSHARNTRRIKPGVFLCLFLCSNLLTQYYIRQSHYIYSPVSSAIPFIPGHTIIRDHLLPSHQGDPMTSHFGVGCLTGASEVC